MALACMIRTVSKRFESQARAPLSLARFWPVWVVLA